MPLILPESVMSSYQRFWELPETRVTAMFQHISTGRKLPQLTEMDDESVHGLYLRLSVARHENMLSEGRVNPAIQAAYEQIDEERILRTLNSAASANESALLELSAELELQINQARNYLAKFNLVSAEMTLDNAMALLPKPMPECSHRINLDFKIIESTILHARADLYIAKGDSQRADLQFNKALITTQEIDTLAGHKEHTHRLILNYCSFLSKCNPDKLLEYLLEPLQAAMSQKVSIYRINLIRQLAEFYSSVHDEVATSLMLNRLTTDLTSLGFADTQSGDYLDVLPIWLQCATNCDRRYVERIRILGDIVVAYMSLHTLKFQSMSGCIDDETRMNAVVELSHCLNQLDMDSYEKTSESTTYGSHSTAENPTPVLTDSAIAERQLLYFTHLANSFSAGDRSITTIDALSSIAIDNTYSASYRGEALLKLGITASETGDYTLALRHFDDCIEIGQKFSRINFIVEATQLKSVLAAEQDDWQQVSDVTADAISRIEAARSAINAPYVSSAFMSDKYQIYLLGINAARKMSDNALMLDRMELLKARELLTQTDKFNSALNNVADDLTTLMDISLDTSRSSQARAHALEKRRILWDQCQILRSKPHVHFNLPKLQRLIEGKAVVLNYFFLHESVLLITAIDSSSTETIRIEISNIDVFYTALNRLSKASWQTPGLQYDIDDVSPVLLPDSLKSFLQRGKKLIVCLHQALHSIPFLALNWQGQPLFFGMSVGLTPNLTCLSRVADKSDAVIKHRVFALATEQSIDMTGKPLEKLGRVEKEAQQFAQAMGSDSDAGGVYLGSAASRKSIRNPAIRQRMSLSQVLFFGLHGSDVAEADVVNQPMEACLYLSDGPIDGLTISTFDLKARLVVLAACYSGKRAVSSRGLARLPADTVYGLQAAFQQAGAQSIIGALWPANDGATPKIMAAMAKYLYEKRTPDEALQLALIDFHSTASFIEKDPGLWACFQCIGFSGDVFGLNNQEF